MKTEQGGASKELIADALQIRCLGGELVLDGDEFVPELFGLPFQFRFEPLLPLSISGRPDGFVIFDLIPNDGVKDHRDFVGGRRDRGTRAQLGFHPA